MPIYYKGLEVGNFAMPFPDNLSLPLASDKEIGGVLADSATEEDTQPVRIGSDGKLYTAQGGNGGGGGLAVKTVIDEPFESYAGDVPNSRWKGAIYEDGTFELFGRVTFSHFADSMPIYPVSILSSGAPWFIPTAIYAYHTNLKYDYCGVSVQIIEPTNGNDKVAYFNAFLKDGDYAFAQGSSALNTLDGTKLGTTMTYAINIHIKGSGTPV